jgi:hypothetical protein
MTFRKLFDVPKETNISSTEISSKQDQSIRVNRVILEKKETPEGILRGNGFKIKLITPTAFGTQIDLARKYDEEEIKKVLSNFNFKMKNQSIFIIE